MKIQHRTINIANQYLDPVTYIPSHANGNAGHKDAEAGVIIRRNEKFVFVLFCKSRTVQAVNPEDLIWG